MMTKISRVGIKLLLLGSCCCSAMAATNDNPVVWGDISGGLRMSAKIESSIINASQPIQIDVVLSNATNRAVIIAMGKAGLLYEVVAFNLDGTQVVALANRDSIRRGGGLRPYGRIIHSRLLPGKKLVEAIEVDGPFKDLEAGTYDVVVSRSATFQPLAEGCPRVVSARLRVNVVGAD